MLMVEKMPPYITDSLIPCCIFSTVRLSSIEDCYSLSGYTSCMVKLVTLGDLKDTVIDSSLSHSVEFLNSKNLVVLVRLGELFVVRF
jgi:hypothetical protein